MKIEKWFCDKCGEEMLPIASTGGGTVKTSFAYEDNPGCFECKEAEYLLCEKCSKELVDWLEKKEITIEIPPIPPVDLKSFIEEINEIKRRRSQCTLK